MHSCWCPCQFCVQPTVAPASSMALTNATDSDVQERTVSVRPSLNIRVIDDSYVRQNTLWSYKVDGLVLRGYEVSITAMWQTSQYFSRWLQAYPELCQLQSQLYECIRASPALLNQAFSKLREQIGMKIHIISYLLGWQVWSFNDFLALSERKTESVRSSQMITCNQYY